MTWKIIAADDQEFILKLISFALSNYEVLPLSCGTQVLPTIETVDKAGQLNMLALVILDIMMPNISGLDVLTEIRQQYPDIQVMMCSALSTIESVNQAFSLGAVDYIVKPVNGAVLRNKVAKVVQRRQQAHALSHTQTLHLFK